jgi:uncharacterized membrane protein
MSKTPNKVSYPGRKLVFTTVLLATSAIMLYAVAAKLGMAATAILVFTTTAGVLGTLGILSPSLLGWTSSKIGWVVLVVCGVLFAVVLR